MTCTGSCHCGAVQVELAQAPTQIGVCNCSLCVKLGVRWAYYQQAETRISGALTSYRRADKTAPSLEVMRCTVCGCVSHWQPLDGRTRLGINVHLLPPEILAGVPVQLIDGRAWPIQ